MMGDYKPKYPTNYSSGQSPKAQVNPPLYQVILKRIFCYALLTGLTFVGYIHFVYGLLLLPIKLFSPTLFRKACTFCLSLSVPAFLCIPFSWRGCRVYTNGAGHFRDHSKKNVLILANHSARIDWVMGLHIADGYNQRVSFITEAFVMMLPIIGWFRWIVEDMFVFRSFKRDRDRLEKNIQEFHDSNVTRWVFLCPEGAIVDFSQVDKNYIRDCEKFCIERGMEPFEMVLTPRYKGMQCFNKLVTKGRDIPAVNVSAAMTYVQNGERLVKPLRDDTRIIPDLWTLVNGGLEVYAHCHLLELSNEPDKLKEQLMRDYSLKDKLLKQFYLTGKFPSGHPTLSTSPPEWQAYNDPDLASSSDPNDTFQQLKIDHVKMNLSFIGVISWYLLGLSYLGLLHTFPMFLSVMYVLIVFSHMLGEYLANGQSRESLPFEGCTKAIFFRLQGREGTKADSAEKQAFLSQNPDAEVQPELDIPAKR